MAAGGRSAPGPGGTRGRRRRRGGPRWSKSARRPPPPPPGAGTAPVSSSAGVPAPLPPGAEVEVRVDDDGFHGSWFEATVVDFAPARGPRTPARYTVTYAHLLDDDGGGVLAEPFAVTHVRPRPPPPSDSSPPRFRPHDIVEAFHNDGWWSGVVVSAPDSPPDPGATVVTVAFPITREVIRFPPRLVRPRRDYVDGGWAPSRAAMVVRPKRAIKVYRVGDKVEVGRDRDVYGYSWFPATVARVVDDLSYVVEYFDLEEEGDAGSGKATEYLHWRFIRPAVEHMPRESEFRLGPGAAVEAYCDGAWSPGVVRRLVGDGEWEVSIVGKKAELLVTKVVELLKPQYKWNGKQWKIVTAKRRGNLRRRSMPGQNPSSPVEVISSADEYSHGPESSVTKKSRKKLQQLDAIVTEVSQMDTPLSALCKSPESNHSDSQVSEKNSLQPPSHGIVSSAPMNGLLCASSGRSTPQNESIANSTGETVDNQETLSEMMDSDGPLNTHAYGASAGDAHDMLSIAELRKKMVSAKTRKKVVSVKALEVKKGISKSKGGNTHPIQELHGKNDASDNIQLNGTINFSKKDIVCALSAFGEGQTTKTPDREVPRRTNRGSSTKVLAYKKLAKRNVPRELCSPHSSLDVTSTVQQRGRKKVAGPMEESLLAEELDKTLEDSWNIADLTEQDLLPMVPPGFESMYDENGAHIHGCLSEEEPNAMISEANINADVCTDHAATQVAKSNYPMKEAILSVDNQAQEGSRKVDERPILQCRQNAYSTQCPMDNASLRSCSASGISMPSPLPVSQVSGDVLFVKGSSMWALIEAMDVFKEVPQRPHFLSLRQLSPTLREGAALGLMVSFAELVKNTREASIDHSMEWFEDKMNTLCHLEANGFNVQFLQSTLTKLVHIKSDGTSYLGQIDKLKAQIVGKTASSSRMDAVLGEKDRGIAELEQKLGRLRQESQRIAQDKEHEEAELFRLQAARSRFEEAYGDTKRQFHNVLAELHRKRLT